MPANTGCCFSARSALRKFLGICGLPSIFSPLLRHLPRYLLLHGLPQAGTGPPPEYRAQHGTHDHDHPQSPSMIGHALWRCAVQ